MNIHRPFMPEFSRARARRRAVSALLVAAGLAVGGCGSDNATTTNDAITGSTTTTGDGTVATQPGTPDKLAGDAAVAAMVEAGWIPASIDGTGISDASVGPSGGSLTVKGESFEAIHQRLGFTEKEGAFAGSPTSDCFIGSGVELSDGVFKITMSCPATGAAASSTTQPSESNSASNGGTEWPASVALPAGATIVSEGSEFTMTYTGPAAYDTLTAWLNSIGTVEQGGGDDKGLRIVATSSNPDLVALLPSGNSASSATLDVNSGSAPGTFTLFIR